MTENEDIEKILYMGVGRSGIDNENSKIAKALNELMQYRAIGSVEEVKAIVNIGKWGYRKGYNKAIDDFVHKVKEHQYVLSDVINSKDYGMFTIGIEQIAEQLKAGGENE